MSSNITLLTYTHSNCSDVWPLYFKSLYKYSKFRYHKCLSNTYLDYAREVDTVIYKDEENYSESFIRALDSVKTEFLLYMQEDFILYGYVESSDMARYVRILQESDLSFMRLVKCGPVSELHHKDDTYFITNPGSSHTSLYCFSLQPTIWKVKDLKRLHGMVRSSRFGEFDSYMDCMNGLGMNGLYAYNSEPKRGGSHYDSHTFPAVLSAIIKGRWNLTEYNKELVPLLVSEGIDPHVRGIH